MKKSIMILDRYTHTDTHRKHHTMQCVCVVSWISQMEGQESPDRIKPSTIWWPCCLCSQTHTHTCLHACTHTPYRVLGKTASPPQDRACGPVDRVWSCCERTCYQRPTGRVPPRSLSLIRPPGERYGGEWQRELGGQLRK